MFNATKLYIALKEIPYMPNLRRAMVYFLLIQSLNAQIEDAI